MRCVSSPFPLRSELFCAVRITRRGCFCYGLTAWNGSAARVRGHLHGTLRCLQNVAPCPSSGNATVSIFIQITLSTDFTSLLSCENLECILLTHTAPSTPNGFALQGKLRNNGQAVLQKSVSSVTHRLLEKPLTSP